MKIKTLHEILLSKAEKTQTRLCKVDGDLAYFHGWVEEDRTVFNIDILVKRHEQETLTRCYSESGIAPVGTHADIIRNTFALVEFPDGSVKKVEPEKVRFLDREAKR